MSKAPVVRTTSLGQTISSVSFTEAYAELQPPQVGQYFVLTDPASPVRSGISLDSINMADDAGELGSIIRFGHPMKVREVGKSYSSVELPTHGGDPIAGSTFHLAVENHKLRVPLTLEQAQHYTRNPSAVVVERTGLDIEDVATGTRHRLSFGSRLHDLSGNSFSVGADAFRREFRVCGSLEGLGEVRNEGVSLQELVRRVSAFSGAYFAWGHAGLESSDASGWIQALLGSFGVHVPHNTRRMDRHLRDAGNIGTEISHFSDLKTGDLIFIGTRSGNVSYMGMIEVDQDGRLAMRHCRGKGGWQGSYLDNKSDVFNATEIEGFPGFEIKSAWRVIDLDL